MKKRFLLFAFVLFAANSIVCAQLKPNDYLVAKIQNPSCGAAVFKYNELTPQNTGFLSQSEYRNTPFVKREFTINGVFQEAEWKRFYELLSEEWYRFCYWNYKRCAELEVVYSPSSMYKPTNVKVIYCHGCTFWKIIKQPFYDKVTFWIHGAILNRATSPSVAIKPKPQRSLTK